MPYVTHELSMKSIVLAVFDGRDRLPADSMVGTHLGGDNRIPEDQHCRAERHGLRLRHSFLIRFAEVASMP